MLGRVVHEVCGAGCYGRTPPIHGFVEPVRWVNDRLNGFLPRLQSHSFGWRWASIVAPCQSARGNNEDPRAGGLPLIWFSCAMECAGTPALVNGPFDSALALGDNGGRREGGDAD